MSDKAFCTKCGSDLEYRESSFEQYEPSDYKCKKCDVIYSCSWVKGAIASREHTRKDERKKVIDEVIEILEENFTEIDGEYLNHFHIIDEIRKAFLENGSTNV